MQRRNFVLGVLLVLLSVPALSQTPGIPKVGVVVAAGGSSAAEAGFREGLRELGYVEGTTIHVEWRRITNGNEELLKTVADLLSPQVDILVTSGSPATQAALRATTVPVVFLAGDPVGAGFAKSLARPGGNATGVSAVSTDLNQKALDFLHQLLPDARQISYLRNPSNPLAPAIGQEVENAARILGLNLTIVGARNATELTSALNSIRRSKPDGVLVSPEMFFLAHRDEITATMRKAKLPTMFTLREYHDSGALATYGISLRQAMRRIAAYVDKILKGAMPADMPIEQISTYELVVNLRVAREMGVKVPQSVLISADEVIR